MAKVSIGDHVSDLAGTRDGKLVEIEGTTGYVLQANGVEIEFPLDRLKPYAPPETAKVETRIGPNRDRVLTPAQKALLAKVPPEIIAAIAKSYDAGAEPGRPSFAALPDSRRLETIRIYLPSLPQSILTRHTNLVVAMRDLAKPGR